MALEGALVDDAAVDLARRRWERFMAEHGKKSTRQRRVIVDVFLRAGGHLSIQEILERAQREEPGIGYATVYRTMKLLTEAGVAHEQRFGGEALYELAVEEHHDHIICTTCDRIFEFEDQEIERRQEEVARRRGLRIVQHRHEIYAECIEPEHCPHRAEVSCRAGGSDG